MGRRFALALAAAVLTCSGLVLAAPASGAATYDVVSGADDGAAGTFRWAVAQAGANPGPDVVNVAPSVTAITLDDCLAGRVEIAPTGLLTVNGSGATITQTCPAEGVLGGVGDMTLNDLTLTGGHTTGNGGAVELNGRLTLDGVAITGNAADGDGGGIVTVGATITNSTITGNRAGGRGGGIHLVGGGEITITSTTVTDNRSVGDGGGLWVDGDARLWEVDLRTNATEGDGGGGFVTGEATVERSTVAANQAGATIGGIGGEDIVAYLTTVSGNIAGTAIGGIGGGRVRVFWTAVTGNQAPGGGGVGAASSAEIKNSTIAENVGGGIDASGPIELSFATVVGNQGTNLTARDRAGVLMSVIAFGSDADCSFPPGSTTSSGYSFSGDATCGFSGTGDTNGGGDPMLAPLALNGGPTENMLPRSGSPLLRRVPDNVFPCSIPSHPITLPYSFTLDQRRLPRVTNGACDIGAVEVQPVSGMSLSVSTPYQTPVVTDLAMLVTDPDGVLATYQVDGAAHGSLDAAAGGLVTYTPDAGFSGTDSYIYVVCSVGDAICTASQTITIAVGPGAAATVATPVATPVAASPTFTG